MFISLLIATSSLITTICICTQSIFLWFNTNSICRSSLPFFMILFITNSHSLIYSIIHRSSKIQIHRLNRLPSTMSISQVIWMAQSKLHRLLPCCSSYSICIQANMNMNVSFVDVLLWWIASLDPHPFKTSSGPVHVISDESYASMIHLLYNQLHEPITLKNGNNQTLTFLPYYLLIYLSPSMFFSIVYSSLKYLYTLNPKDSLFTQQMKIFITLTDPKGLFDFLPSLSSSFYVTDSTLSLLRLHFQSFLSQALECAYPLTADQSLALLHFLIRLPDNKEKEINQLINKYNVHISRKESLPKDQKDSIMSLLLQNGYIHVYISLYKRLYNDIHILDIYLSCIHLYKQDLYMQSMDTYQQNEQYTKDSQFVTTLEQELWKALLDVCFLFEWFTHSCTNRMDLQNWLLSKNS